MRRIGGSTQKSSLSLVAARQATGSAYARHDLTHASGWTIFGA